MPTGKAFLQMSPFLKLYSTYANNHERALATMMVIHTFLHSNAISVAKMQINYIFVAPEVFSWHYVLHKIRC